jgi:aminoglycoside phosphotransferase
VAARARATTNHAETLESFARARQVGVQAHAYELDRAKSAVNSMGADLRRLQELRTDALPWQQMLINRLEPMLSNLASHATDAIEYWNTSPRSLDLREYKNVIGNISAYADGVDDLISVNVDYAKARGELDRFNARSTAEVS